MAVVLAVGVGLGRLFFAQLPFTGIITTPWDAQHWAGVAGTVLVCLLLGWGAAFLLGVRGKEGRKDTDTVARLIAVAIGIGLVPLWVYNGATGPLVAAALCPKVTASLPATITTPTPGYLVGGGDRLYFGYPLEQTRSGRYIRSVPLGDGTLQIWNAANPQPVCPAPTPTPVPTPTPTPVPTPIPMPLPDTGCCVKAGVKLPT